MDEDDFIALSALQHYRFCPRQCALIHIEQPWLENRLTAQGRVLHENTDKPRARSTGPAGSRVVTAMPLQCRRLGLYGVADTVEFLPDGRPFPVEYKRGKPKPDDRDAVQLCAQALCLEEMTGNTVPEGALFYGETRRRLSVVFDTLLRAETERLAAAIYAMIRAGSTPPATYDPAKCDACSLRPACQPRSTEKSARLETAWQTRLHHPDHD